MNEAQKQLLGSFLEIGQQMLKDPAMTPAEFFRWLRVAARINERKVATLATLPGQPELFGENNDR